VTSKVLIAHRPGFVAPTLVARELATLDLLTGGGRVAIHHITGGDEADQRRDGDFAGHDERYHRTAEFMDVLRRELTSSEPFAYGGELYRVEGAFSHVKPAAPVPLYFGGAPAPAVAAGARGPPRAAPGRCRACWCRPARASRLRLASEVQDAGHDDHRGRRLHCRQQPREHPVNGGAWHGPRL
jgi:alkanesulfonate monooxygenase SsuD/methylene tetrahydromethanopterin reductase-like flavin-dependent oxidoreductase (luciferase family)